MMPVMFRFLDRLRVVTCFATEVLVTGVVFHCVIGSVSNILPSSCKLEEQKHVKHPSRPTAILKELQ